MPRQGAEDPFYANSLGVPSSYMQALLVGNGFRCDRV